MAGHEAASQVWLLLGASLVQYIPEYPPTPPLSPPPSAKKVLSPLMTQNPQLTPAGGYSFPPSLSTKTTDSATSGHKISPGRRSTTESLSRMSSHIPSSSTSRRLTPTSSTSSSPHHLPIALPPGMPLKSSPFGRRESVDSGVFATSALLRRPSLSVPPLQSSSPVDRSMPSLRHVGEGVLDSDSSGSEEEEDGDGEETANANASDEEPDVHPLTSPVLTGTRMIPAGPSPLSRIASHQVWTEDEDDPARDDDDASPSPQSTDTESNSSGSPGTISRSTKVRHKSSTQTRIRSRSSTVASLAAPQSRPLTHHQSHSSIRTITAAETSLNHDDIQDVEVPSTHQHPQAAHSGHSRQKSQTISELAINNSKPTPVIPNEPEQQLDESHLTERRIDIIQMEEKKFRDTTLDTLRGTFEEFADEVRYFSSSHWV